MAASNDPILSARLEALIALADGISQPVAVLRPDLSIVYANEATSADLGGNGSDLRVAKCYEVFGRRADPCGLCPAMKVFESYPEYSELSKPTVCGLRQVIPLVSEQGEVGLVLVKLEGQNNRLGVDPEATSDADSPSRLGDLIGESPVMQSLFEVIRLVADSQATVLIQGESGTGKELVAKTIHALSPRRDNPFVVVDCGSLPETLLESELFGHVKGAFTGAVRGKKGLFEEADGGTIFLDEIADTSPQFQAKLLRVLQEGEIKPVGSSQRIKVNARAISATNKNLEELVRSKTFRHDLYYRLAVLPLHLPPLRDRKEDIPLLVRHFVAMSCTRHRRPVRNVSAEVMRTLSHAVWPGNVRQLQHFIERAVITTTGPDLSCEEIGSLGTRPSCGALRSIARGATQQAERSRILEALSESGGNRAKAARLLQISRASLYNKLKAYQIDEAPGRVSEHCLRSQP